MKIKFLVFLIVLSYFFILADNQLIPLFKTEVENLPLSMPLAFERFISSITSNGDLFFDTFKHDELIEKLNSYGFNEPVIEKFKSILFSKSTTFQSFHMSFQITFGTINELIGVARNNNGIIDIGYINVNSIGMLIPQYDLRNLENCYRIFLFFNKCDKYTVLNVRGYYADELNLIIQALRIHGYIHIKNQLNEYSYVSFLENSTGTNQNILSEINYDKIVSAFNDILIYTDLLPKENKYYEFIKTDYNNIFESIKYNKYLYIDQDSINDFINKILKDYEFKGNEYIKEIIEIKLKDEAKHVIEQNIFDTSSIFHSEIIRFAFQNQKRLIFYEILFFHNEEQKKFDIHVKSLIANILIENEFYSLKVDNDKNFPSTNDIDELLKVFECILVSIIKPTDDTFVKSQFTSLNFLDESDSSMGFLQSLIEKVSNVWNDTLNVFRSKQKTSIVKNIINRGFDFFDQTTQIQVFKSLKQEGLEKLINVTSSRLNIPLENYENLRIAMRDIIYSDANIWNLYDVIFSINTGGETKFVSIFSSRNDDNTFNFVIVDVKNSFILAPNLIFISKKLSILGGIYSSENNFIENIPKQLNEDDVKVTLNFFQMISYKQIANYFGMNLKLPKEI